MQIQNSITIESGVTVILPYDTNGSAEGGNIETNIIESDGSVKAVYRNSDSDKTPDAERNPMKANELATADLCTTKVFVCNNVKITVNGTLTISGQLDGGGGGAKYSGQTSGYHARVILNNNSQINVGRTGVVRVLGFIEDKSAANTPSCVNVDGSICQPFVVRDFKGGSVLTGIYTGMGTYSYSPFNQFQFINIHAKVVINHGATMRAYANLYAGSQHNATIGNMVGNTSNYVIQLSQGSRLEAKYDVSTEIMDLHFYGGASTNALVLNAAGTMISSNDFVFPISWMYNITLDCDRSYGDNDEETIIPANYHLRQAFKLMPGSSMTVCEGVTLKVNALSVYESFSDVDCTTLPGTKYPVKDPAKLIVNGTLIAGKLGGNVYTNNEKGEVVVQATSSVSFKTYEPKEYKTLRISARFTYDLPLVLYNIDGTTLDVTNYYAGIRYYTDKGEWKVPPYFELVVGEGYTVTVKEWYQYDESNNLVKHTNDSGEVFRSGMSCFLPTSGISATYTLDSNKYVIFENGMEADYNSRGVGLTKVIYSPLQVKVVPTLIISEDFREDGTREYTITLLDFNDDGYCETVLVEFTAKIGADGKIEVKLEGTGVEAIYGYTGIEGTLSEDKLTYTITCSDDSGVDVSITANIVVGSDTAITLTFVKGTIDNGCVTPDTLVTLADGSQKEIQYLTYEDMLLVWDFYTGKYVVVPAALIVNHGYGDQTIIKLTFEDGTVVKAITAHSFFDADTNKWELINANNAYDYLGHEFVQADGNSYTTVKLVGVEVYTEYTESYSLVSAYHYNFITENMFSLTNSVHNMLAGLVVGENMTYDQIAMESDLEAYGKYTYDDFAEYISYEQYVAFNGDYLKISVGKGYLTFEDILELIRKYL